ncbi:hypothetical protein ACFXMT_15205 [Streptomyces mirabilis]
MLLAPPVRPDHADKIAGVVHVDGTARCPHRRPPPRTGP